MVVVEEHQVYIQQRRQFVRRVRRQFTLQQLDLVDDGRACGIQARSFVWRPLGGHEVVRHVDAAGGHQHGAPSTARPMATPRDTAMPKTWMLMGPM